MNLETPVATSSSVARANMVTVWLEVTVCTEARATTAQKIEARRPSHRVLGSLARPYEKHSSRRGSALPRLSPSTTARPNSSFGSLISAWRVSWAGPSTTESSSDNSPCSCPTPLEPGSRIFRLSRSMTGMIS
jgi:hypothetical protein